MTRREAVIFEPPIAQCPLCGVRAICVLPPEILAQQPDETTLVCHPGYGGCNQGFVRDEDPERLSTAFAVHVRHPEEPESVKGYTYRAWLAAAGYAIGEGQEAAEAAWRAGISPWEWRVLHA